MEHHSSMRFTDRERTLFKDSRKMAAVETNDLNIGEQLLLEPGQGSIL